MRIESVAIKDFRVLTSLKLTLSPGINLIWGDNGAGKTSVLEAVFVAARGRSFRHQEAGPFIRTGAGSAQVVAKLRDDSGQPHVLGIERGARQQQVRFDGTTLSRRSEQVRALPLQLLTPNSHALIEGAPELRRRYLDLGLFHVEHQYHRWYAEYQRALRQRNAALRTQVSQARSWDGLLAERAVQLGNVRESYVAALSEEMVIVLGRLAPDLAVKLSLRAGWDTSRDLAEQLAERFEVDCRQGYTGLGPHRADLLIWAEDVVAAKRLSRGQQKLVVAALMMAQVTLQRQRSDTTPVLLLDDLPAELDRTHRGRVMTELSGLDVQVLITAVDPDSLMLPDAAGVFHVEQGGCLDA